MIDEAIVPAARKRTASPAQVRHGPARPAGGPIEIFERARPLTGVLVLVILDALHELPEHAGSDQLG